MRVAPTRPAAASRAAWRAPEARLCVTSPALQAHPDLAVLEVFLLPDGHGALERVDRVAARLERIGAVRGRDRDQHRRLADLEAADPVQHRDASDAGPARA